MYCFSYSKSPPSKLHVPFVLHTEFYLGDQIKEDEMVRTCGTHGVLVGKPKGRKPFLRPCCKLNYNSKMDLKNRMGGHGLISPGSGHGNGGLL